DRGSGLLREGPGREVRFGRQSDLGPGQAAFQHRRRRPLQQPSRQPRRPDQGPGGGAADPRRGAPRGPGKEHPAGAGARDGRFARHAPRQRHGHSRYGGRMSTQAQEREYPAPAINVESKRFWDATKEGKLLIGLCKDTGKHFFYPRSTSPFTLSKNVEWVEASGRGTIYSFSVMRRAPIPYAIA